MPEAEHPNTPLPLSTKHAGWIIGWALEHCALSIMKLENDLVRHRILIDGSYYAIKSVPNLGSALRTARADEIVKIENSLNEYHAILAWLVNAKERIDGKHADEFAQSIADMFKNK